MIDKIYTVYVGHYKTTSDSKNDLKRINELGYKAYLFNIGECFSLKVYTCYNAEQALYAENIFKKRNFDAFTEIKDIKK